MNKSDICVLVPIYNQSVETIDKTLKSIAMQKDVSYEVMLADDHSTIDITPNLETLCRDYRLENWKVIRHDRNLQTIKNMLVALNFINSKYVIALGAGDALYDENALKEIVDFCDEYDVKVGFGNAITDFNLKRFNSPKNSDEYAPPQKSYEQRRALFQHQIATADWVSGCCQFYEVEAWVKLLKQLYDEIGIRFCEDFSAALILETDDVFHLDAPIVLYETEGGISNNGSLESRKRLYEDNRRFYRWAVQTRPFGLSYERYYALFKLKEFIALHTPLYSFFQRRLQKSYIQD